MTARPDKYPISKLMIGKVNQGQISIKNNPNEFKRHLEENECFSYAFFVENDESVGL